MPKRLPPFQAPKGVPADIRRALRLPKPGRFISSLKALQLHDLLAQREQEIRRVYDKAYLGMERARTLATRDKHIGILRQTQEAAGRVRHGLELLDRAIGQEPLPPLAASDVRPIVQTERPSAEYIRKGELAREWEIGIDYSAEAGWHPRKGWSSSVSFNARIFDPDDALISEAQIREAISFFASEGELSYRKKRGRRILEVQTVNWETANGRQREGDVNDLDNFRSILMTVGDGGLRVGAVKEDDL